MTLKTLPGQWVLYCAWFNRVPRTANTYDMMVRQGKGNHLGAPFWNPHKTWVSNTDEPTTCLPPRLPWKSRAHKNPNTKRANTLSLPAKEKGARCLRKKHMPSSSAYPWERIRKGNTVCLELMGLFCFCGYGVLTPLLLGSRTLNVVMQGMTDSSPLLVLFNDVPQNVNFRFSFSSSWLLRRQSSWKAQSVGIPHLPWTQWCSVLYPIPSVPTSNPSASNKHATEYSTWNHKKQRRRKGLIIYSLQCICNCSIFSQDHSSLIVWFRDQLILLYLNQSLILSE